MADSSERDAWAKLDILAKAVGAVAIPLALCYLGWVQREDDKLRADTAQTLQLSQQNADRATKLLDHLASEKPQQQKLAIHLAQFLEAQDALPEGVWAFIGRLMKDPNPTVQTAATEASQRHIAAQVAATSTKSDAGADAVPPQQAVDVERAREAVRDSTVREVVTPANVAAFAGARVLWVDDHPENNTSLVSALTALGMQVHAVTSTDEAVEATGRLTYDLIISDQGRAGDGSAGYKLFNRLGGRALPIPFILYTSHAGPSERAAGKARGIADVTNIPEELLSIVKDKLAGR